MIGLINQNSGIRNIRLDFVPEYLQFFKFFNMRILKVMTFLKIAKQLRAIRKDSDEDHMLVLGNKSLPVSDKITNSDSVPGGFGSITRANPLLRCSNFLSR